jgi:HlyD family secretion protein
LFLIGKDMHFMQVDTNVSEADVGGVKPGQQAYFTVQAFPNRTFSGRVRQIREGPITVQNVVTYDVVVDVPNDDLSLFPGMTADAHIITAQRRNVLRVPLPAIRFNPAGLADVATGGARTGRRAAAPTGAGVRGRPFAANVGAATQGADEARNDRARLWLLRDGKLIAVRVRAGLDDGTLIEVSGEDLQPDDRVVVNAVKSGAEASASQAGNRPGAGLGFRGGLRL